MALWMNTLAAALLSVLLLHAIPDAVGIPCDPPLPNCSSLDMLFTGDSITPDQPFSVTNPTNYTITNIGVFEDVSNFCGNFSGHVCDPAEDDFICNTPLRVGRVALIISLRSEVPWDVICYQVITTNWNGKPLYYLDIPIPNNNTITPSIPFNIASPNDYTILSIEVFENMSSFCGDFSAGYRCVPPEPNPITAVTCDPDLILQNRTATLIVLLQSTANMSQNCYEVITVNWNVIELGFEKVTYTFSEDEGTATLCLQQLGTVSEPATVDISVFTWDGTANDEFDYILVPPSIFTIRNTPGRCVENITLYIVENTHIEGTESFSVHLNLNSAPTFVYLFNSSANVTIMDNDYIHFTFEHDAYYVDEGTSISLCLELIEDIPNDPLFTANIKVSAMSISATDGTDFRPLSVEFIFDFNSKKDANGYGTDFWILSREFTFNYTSTDVNGCIAFVEIRIYEDSEVEGPEVFFVTLSSEESFVQFINQRANITIQDNDVIDNCDAGSIGECDANCNCCIWQCDPPFDEVKDCRSSTNYGTCESYCSGTAPVCSNVTQDFCCDPPFYEVEDCCSSTNYGTCESYCSGTAPVCGIVTQDFCTSFDELNLFCESCAVPRNLARNITDLECEMICQNFNEDYTDSCYYNLCTSFDELNLFCESCAVPRNLARNIITNLECEMICQNLSEDYNDSCYHNLCCEDPPDDCEDIEQCSSFCLDERSECSEVTAEFCEQARTYYCNLNCTTPENFEQCFRATNVSFNCTTRIYDDFQTLQSSLEMCGVTCNASAVAALGDDAVEANAMDDRSITFEECERICDDSDIEFSIPNCSSLLCGCRNCSGNNTLCKELCDDSESVGRCGVEACAEVLDSIEEEDCENSALFATNCSDPQNFMHCLSICSRPSTDTDCDEELASFCVNFFLDTNSQEFSSRAVDQSVSILNGQEPDVDNAVQNIETIVDYLEEFPNDTTDYLDQTAAMNLLEVVDKLFLDERIEEWEGLDEEEMHTASTMSVQQIERVGKLLAGRISSRNEHFYFQGDNMILAADMPDPEMEEDYTFPRPNMTNRNTSLSEKARVKIPYQLFMRENPEEEDPAVVTCALVTNLPSYLDRNTSVRRARSDLLSCQVLKVSDLLDGLKEYPINFEFTVSKPLEGMANFSCAYWDFSIDDWSTRNVSTDDTVMNSTIACNTSHLTSFAVLVDVTGEDAEGSEAFALSIVTYVGCAISIICLLLTIFFLIVFRKILNKGPLLYIHLNLAIALLLAMIVFVAGIDTATSVDWLCTVVAALLHYFFLCVFCWMLAEGIMLYMLIVKVFGKAAERWYYLLILGWGLPIIIVAVSAGLFHEDYGTEQFCWIDADSASVTIWLFVVPMLIVILINTAILIMTIATMLKGRKYGGAEQEVKTTELVKSAIKGTVILLPLLGITWVFGLLAVNRDTTVFIWLFTICNSLQGLFIFILHVLKNDLLQGRLRRRARRAARHYTRKERPILSTTNELSKEQHIAETEMMSHATESAYQSDQVIAMSEFQSSLGEKDSTHLWTETVEPQ